MMTPTLSIPAFRSLRHAFVLLLAALALTAAGVRAQSADDQPNPRLPGVKLQAGMHLITAEVASEPGTRAKGLMHRTQLGNNEGMLFIFERKAQHCFWMRNTLIPLSIAFIDDDGLIVNIEDMAARTEDSHCPLRAIRYALEMEKGWFARKGIQAGTRLGPKTFFAAKP